MTKFYRKLIQILLATHMAWTSCALAAEPSGNIEPGRALVPVGEVTTVPAVPEKPGHSGMNAPSREFLPEFSERYKPSRIGQTMEEAGIKLSNSRELVVYSGEDLNAQARRSALYHEALSGLKGAGKAAGAFYVALGFVAAYNLIMSGETNPVAWESYWQSMPWNDPVGALALIGFLAGAAYFYKKMGAIGPNGGVLRQLPFFASALFVGALISTSVSVVAANEHVKACIASKFKDCDKAFNWAWDSAENQGMISEIANGYIPLAANILVAGGIYLGTVQTASFIYNRYKIGEALQTLSRGKISTSSAKPGWIGVTMLVVHGTLFLLAARISNALFGIEKWVREFIITKSGFTNRYGHSLEEAETKLYTEWIKAKKDGHVHKDPMIPIINRYNKLQNAFRTVQLQETLGAFQQWMTKQSDFVNLVGASYDFYKTNLPLIREDKFTPDILTKPLPTPNADLERANMAGTWKLVFTPRVQHFLLTSMACGAEAEGYHAGGVWQATRQFMANWWTFNYSPDKMIKNHTGMKVAFYPPRITNPLPGEDDTICEKKPYVGYPNLQSDPDKLSINFGGKRYTGLPAYIKDNVRQSVTDDFDGWWARNVTTAALEVQKDLRKEYEKMLKEHYIPALTSREKFWCEPHSIGPIGIERYLQKFVRAGDPCGPEGTHRLNYGILNSIRDELRLYLAMAIDIYVSDPQLRDRALWDKTDAPMFPKTAADAENVLIPQAQKILAIFDKYAEQLTIVDGQKRKAPELYLMTRKEFDSFAEVIVPPMYSNMPGLATSPAPDSVQVARTLIEKSRQLVVDTGNYFTILTALEDGSAEQ